METKTKIIIAVAVVAVVTVIGLIVVPNVMKMSSASTEGGDESSNAVAASAASYWSMSDPEDNRIKSENIEGIEKTTLQKEEVTKLEEFLTKRFTSDEPLFEYKLTIEEKDSPKEGTRVFRLVDKQTENDYLLKLSDSWNIERGYDSAYAQLKKDVEEEKKKAEQQRAADEAASRTNQASNINSSNNSNGNGGAGSNNTSSNTTETEKVDTTGTVQLSSESAKNVLPDTVRKTLQADLDSALKGNGNSVKKAEDIYIVTNSVSIQDALCKFTIRVNTTHGPMTINCTYDTSADRHQFTSGS